jgi:hypothetical protein
MGYINNIEVDLVSCRKYIKQGNAGMDPCGVDSIKSDLIIGDVK